MLSLSLAVSRMEASARRTQRHRAREMFMLEFRSSGFWTRTRGERVGRKMPRLELPDSGPRAKTQRRFLGGVEEDMKLAGERETKMQRRGFGCRRLTEGSPPKEQRLTGIKQSKSKVNFRIIRDIFPRGEVMLVIMHFFKKAGIVISKRLGLGTLKTSFITNIKQEELLENIF